MSCRSGACAARVEEAAVIMEAEPMPEAIARARTSRPVPSSTGAKNEKNRAPNSVPIRYIDSTPRPGSEFRVYFSEM